MVISMLQHAATSRVCILLTKYLFEISIIKVLKNHFFIKERRRKNEGNLKMLNYYWIKTMNFQKTIMKRVLTVIQKMMIKVI